MNFSEYFLLVIVTFFGIGIASLILIPIVINWLDKRKERRKLQNETQI